MGGIGSGRTRYADTPDVEACRTLDSNDFSAVTDAPHGSYADISWGDNSIRAHVVNERPGDRPDALRLEYVARPEADGTDRYEYKIPLDYTEPHFGGARLWFQCPWCRTRRGKLYLPPGKERFACRECYDLQYRSSRDSGNDLKRAEQRFRKAFSRADKHGRERHPEGMDPPLPEKPDGMHEETFEELMDDVWAAEDEWYEAYNRQVRRLQEQLSG